MLATREDLGSFYCGKTCELVFTTDSGSDTVWNIVPFQHEEENCYEIVKASGYHEGEMMTAKSENIWEEPFGAGGPKLTTTKIVDDKCCQCWEFEHVGGDSYKIKKKLGSAAGKYVRARPINFKEETVPRERRFLELSDDDTYNVWEIKNA